MIHNRQHILSASILSARNLRAHTLRAHIFRGGRSSARPLSGLFLKQLQEGLSMLDAFLVSRGSSRAMSVLLLSALGATAALSQGPATPSTAAAGELFPEPFLVEHYMVQEDETGERYTAPTVVDTYGGSWIVSERPDGSRLVVDLARADLTEIRPAAGTYWTLGFDRLQRLIRRVNELEGTKPEPTGNEPQGAKSRRAEAPEPRILASQWRLEDGVTRAEHGDRLPRKSASMVTAGGIRHLKVFAPEGDATRKSRGTDEPVAEAWVDPAIRLNPAARAALARFERDALGSSSVMEAIRNHSDGAFAIRTKRREVKSDGQAGLVEDVVLRLEKIEAFDRDLVRVPEGLRRIPHPLEGLLAFMEREDRRQKMMSGEGSVDGDGYGGGEN